MILFVAEHANGKLSKSAYELATGARWVEGGDVTALVLGSGVAAVAAEAALIADQVLVADLLSWRNMMRRFGRLRWRRLLLKVRRRSS